MLASPEILPTESSTSHSADRMTLLRELLDGLNRDAPLSVLLDRTVTQLQRLFDADSVSIWLRDGVGLSFRAGCGVRPRREQVELGRGALGLCAATRAPVFSSGDVERLVRPSLSPCDEEVPFRVVAPLLLNGDAHGVVAIETQGRPISESDAELLLALSTGIAGALRADLIRREKASDETYKRRAGGGTRRVVLRGKTFSPGQALGPVSALRRLPRRALNSPELGAARAVRAAFDAAKQTVRELSTRARNQGIGRDADFLGVFEAMLEDSRFRDSAVERVVRGASIHEAFDQLARDSIRLSNMASSDDADARQRAADVEDLFGAVAMLAHDDPRARPPRASVLVGASLTPYDVIVTARSNPVGVVLTERAGGERARALLRLLDVPALLDVGGVSRWVSDGDIALLDATRGFLLLNPTRTEVAALRESRRRIEAS